MDIDVTRQRQAAIFTPQGRIEGSNADQFQEEITRALRPTDEAIIIDLHQVSYVSSAGLRAFAIIAKHLKSNGLGFALTRANKSIKDVITITGFTQIMDVHDTTDDALARLTPAQA